MPAGDTSQPSPDTATAIAAAAAARASEGQLPEHRRVGGECRGAHRHRRVGDPVGQAVAGQVHPGQDDGGAGRPGEGHGRRAPATDRGGTGEQGRGDHRRDRRPDRSPARGGVPRGQSGGEPRQHGAGGQPDQGGDGDQHRAGDVHGGGAQRASRAARMAAIGAGRPVMSCTCSVACQNSTSRPLTTVAPASASRCASGVGHGA